MRQESDALGSRDIPAQAMYGVHTKRASENFQISGQPLAHFPELVAALAQVKFAASKANHALGMIDNVKAQAIQHACDDIIGGNHHSEFIVDMIQGGAGTSTNMNANEVIANLALLRMGKASGEYEHLHPNDDVNRSQSTNDVYPTALRLAVLSHVDSFVAAQSHLCATLEAKALELDPVMKVGRTQLMDAVPMTLGQEFRSFANTIEEDIDRLKEVSQLLHEVNLGGTAIGTGVNAPVGYSELAIAELSQKSGFELKPARNFIEASSDLGALVTFSGILKRIAVKLSKICNDLRLLGSGPRAGLAEIRLPAVQAGSSIMPGKVNPVIPEVVNQVAFQVIGNDLTVTLASEAGQLQLNAMEPIAILNILQSLRILKRAMLTLADLCVAGIEPNIQSCKTTLESSLVMATFLVPEIGYEASSRLAKYAMANGLSLEMAAEELGLDITEKLCSLQGQS